MSTPQDFGESFRFLPSWNDGAAKKAIVDFGKKKTDEASPESFTQALYDEAKQKG